MASNPPIYDQLLQKHGDVVTEAREAADQVRLSAESALDWRELKPPSPAE